MKIKLYIFILVCAYLLIWSTAGYAQLLPHIVQGTFLNPDGSPPDSGEIKFQGYLTKSPPDTSITQYCSAGGGWAIELIFMNKIKDASWSMGDTLIVVFENVLKDGPFEGAKSMINHVTTDESPEKLGEMALPVELTTFMAKSQNTPMDDEVFLEWKTIGETNNLGFEIQKSTDGNAFEKIGFISGAGSTNVAQLYTYIDPDVAVGIYYYRLKQIDTDGSFTYSEIIEVAVKPPERYELSQNFPNPFNPMTEIVFKVKEEGKVVIALYDILGREVKTLVSRDMKAGVHHIEFDGRDLPSGMYLYAMKAGDFSQVKKMAIIK